MTVPTYLHPLAEGAEPRPSAFTFPFCYKPHPLCQRAASLVQDHLRQMHFNEGKMFGVLVVERESLYFLAAYSGQMNGNYDHPWFVPPVFDYLQPDGYFLCEQEEIVGLNHRIASYSSRAERAAWQSELSGLVSERDAAVAEARRCYAEGKARRATQERTAELIRESQQQRADIQRAKRLHADEIAKLQRRLSDDYAVVAAWQAERKRRSEALQQWLFEQFSFLNAKGERHGLADIFGTQPIPSGAGECCAPKLLQAAYLLGAKPLCMAEFWWGPSPQDTWRVAGEFYPACRRKCRPILGHMLVGLNVEPDPALHYNQRHGHLRVVWEDADVAVLDKPAGWLSVPGKSDLPNVEDEVRRLWPDIEGPVMVHRLDMDTSGLLLIAKKAHVHARLQRQFERREVHKRYVALLDGVPACVLNPQKVTFPIEGDISLPLSPDYDDLPRQCVDHQHGAEALTHYQLLGVERGGEVTRVHFYPQTGRTHQLRLHAAHPEGLGVPIVGDRLYGRVAERLCLHAECLEFTHPVSGERLRFQSPSPF